MVAGLRASRACRSWPAAPAPGLSGGALPHADGVLIVTVPMRAILEVAPPTSGPSSSPA